MVIATVVSAGLAGTVTRGNIAMQAWLGSPPSRNKAKLHRSPRQLGKRILFEHS